MRNICFFLVLFHGLTCFTYADTITVSFSTLGNCSICKERIENTGYQVPGVISVTWKIVSKVTTITCDTDSTDVYKVMHAIANAGHDTEWFPAPDPAYNLLIGTCCEYERTINYQDVKVGYLSLMNLWVYPTGVTNIARNQTVAVYPNPFSDHISISCGGMKSSTFTTTLRTQSGNIAATARVVESGILTAPDLIPGVYLLEIFSDGILLDRRKVIKY